MTNNAVKSGINDLYDALLSVLPRDTEFMVNHVKKAGCEAINALGPFERSPFETADICKMLGDLAQCGLVIIRSESHYSKSGRFEGNTLFYTLPAA